MKLKVKDLIYLFGDESNKRYVVNGGYQELKDDGSVKLSYVNVTYDNESGEWVDEKGYNHDDISNCYVDIGSRSKGNLSPNTITTYIENNKIVIHFHICE